MMPPLAGGNHGKTRESYCRRERLTKEEWRLLCEAISEEIEVMEEEDHRKGLH
jgi:hypothetical protein